MQESHLYLTTVQKAAGRQQRGKQRRVRLDTKKFTIKKKK